MIWTRDNLNSATDYQKTQIDYVKARTLFALQDAAIIINAARVLSYLSAFAIYKESRDSRPDVSPPSEPIPAFAMVVIYDEYGNPVEGISDLRVCPLQIYTPLVKPVLAEGLIGRRYYPDNDTYFYCLSGDITPNRKVIKDTTSADGVKGNFEKYAYLSSSPGSEIPGIYIRQSGS